MFWGTKKSQQESTSVDSEQLKTLTENLYKHNIELAVKNKTLSLLRQLYQISIQTFEPEPLAVKMVQAVQETLTFELVGIYLYDTNKDILTPLAHDISERIDKLQEEKRVHLVECIIPHASENSFFKPVIIERKQNTTTKLADIWHDCVSAPLLETFTTTGHIKTTAVYPLVIGEKIIGILVIGLNREISSLSQFEVEAISSIVDVISVGLDKSFLYLKLDKTNKELVVANEHLKEIDKLKSEFVSLATHQIRAPLTAIKGYISEMFEGDFGELPKTMEEPLNIIMRSNENLINIVGDFLNISRIEQGRMTYEFSDFDLAQMAQDVGNELRPNIEKAKLAFSIEIEPNHNYTISADIGKTRQIVGNLIDNAIKYTKQGWIKLSVSKDTKTDMIRVAISDSGVGVTPETKAKLFQKFSRATDANKTNTIGTGLGLYVVKTMVEAQHGKVWVESEGAGKGSTFIVEFPAVHVS